MKVWAFGTVGLFGFHFFYFTAIRNAPPVDANLINYTWPLLIVVMAPRDFLTDERRGLDRYDALKMRVLDDVRDRYRENPLSAMVRLDRRAVAP